MSGEIIDLNMAKESFCKLMQSLSRTDQQMFLEFILAKWNPDSEFLRVNDEVSDDPIFILNSIACDIKQKIPFNAILPTENVTRPLKGNNSDCDPSITLHVDEFLYNDDDIDKLVDNDQLQRYYCIDCGSKNINPLIYISHSTSQVELYYIFNRLLPNLKDKTVLDVGSRLGAVLYGAYVYTDAERIIGVEMNKEFCDLQSEIIDKYKMTDRISIVHKKIEEVPEIIKQSDVIIINNSFEFYLSEDVQINIWKFLEATIRSGTLLVTRPSIETTFNTLMIGISIEKWLKPLKKVHFDEFLISSAMGKDDEFSEILYYEVL